MSHSSVLRSTSFSTSELSLLPLAQLRHISTAISSVPQKQSFVLCCDSNRGYYYTSSWNHALLPCHFLNPAQGTNSKQFFHSCIKHQVDHVWSFMGLINNVVFCSYTSDPVTKRKAPTICLEAFLYEREQNDFYISEARDTGQNILILQISVCRSTGKNLQTHQVPSQTKDRDRSGQVKQLNLAFQAKSEFKSMMSNSVIYSLVASPSGMSEQQVNVQSSAFTFP